MNAPGSLTRSPPRDKRARASNQHRPSGRSERSSLTQIGPAFLPPATKPRQNSYSGDITFFGVPHPGVYQVTTSRDASIDVFENGMRLKPVASSEAKDCHGVRRSERIWRSRPETSSSSRSAAQWSPVVRSPSKKCAQNVQKAPRPMHSSMMQAVQRCDDLMKTTADRVLAGRPKAAAGFRPGSVILLPPVVDARVVRFSQSCQETADHRAEIEPPPLQVVSGGSITVRVWGGDQRQRRLHLLDRTEGIAGSVDEGRRYAEIGKMRGSLPVGLAGR